MLRFRQMIINISDDPWLELGWKTPVIEYQDWVKVFLIWEVIQLLRHRFIKWPVGKWLSTIATCYLNDPYELNLVVIRAFHSPRCVQKWKNVSVRPESTSLYKKTFILFLIMLNKTAKKNVQMPRKSDLTFYEAAESRVTRSKNI